MRILKKISLLIGLACVVSTTAYAANLMDAFQAALNSDPIYKQAEATYNTNKALIPIARAGILPTIGLTGQVDRSKTQTNYGGAGEYPGAGANGSIALQTQEYTLTITQPIFNWAAFKQLQQAQAAVQQAAATYSAAGQDLIIRLATAYFNVLEAQDILRYSEAQQKALQRQAEVAHQRYQVGLDPITSFYKAEAAYDAARAQYLANQNDLENAQESLREITGSYYSDLKTLAHNFPLVSPSPMKINQWVKTSLDQNLNLRSARFGVLAAQQNIKVQSAGNKPTLNAIGQYGETNNRSLMNNEQGTQDNRTGLVGLQLNFPVYSGGITGANTQQAEAQYQLAIAQMEQTYRETVANTRKAFLSVNSQISQVEADRQSIKSHIAALNSIQAGYQAGTQTILDVLQAQSDLFNAETEYTQDRFAYLLNTLKLKEAAGILSPNDLSNINYWLSDSTSLPADAASSATAAAAKPITKPKTVKPMKNVAKAA